MSQSFTYSDILKKDFISYEPSQEMKLVITDLLNLKKNRIMGKLNSTLKYFKKLFFHHHLLIPYVMLHPVTI